MTHQQLELGPPALQRHPILCRLICKAPGGGREGRKAVADCLVASSHFKCLISYSVLGTSVPCQRGPGGSLLEERISSASASMPQPPKLQVWQAPSSMQLALRACLSVNLQQNKSPSPRFGLHACFSRLSGAAASQRRGREQLESEIKHSGNPLGSSPCLPAESPTKGLLAVARGWGKAGDGGSAEQRPALSPLPSIRVCEEPLALLSGPEHCCRGYPGRWTRL